MSTLSDKEKQNYLNQLFEFLELPSISADSRYKETMEETAEWLSNQLINSVVIHLKYTQPMDTQLYMEKNNR